MSKPGQCDINTLLPFHVWVKTSNESAIYSFVIEITSGPHHAARVLASVLICCLKSKWKKGVYKKKCTQSQRKMLKLPKLARCHYCSGIIHSCIPVFQVSSHKVHWLAHHEFPHKDPVDMNY